MAKRKRQQPKGGHPAKRVRPLPPLREPLAGRIENDGPTCPVCGWATQVLRGDGPDVNLGCIWDDTDAHASMRL